MKIKFMATDMDGTLLDDHKRLTSNNIAALQQMHQAGIQISLCTGRPFHTVEPYLHQLNIPCWLITNNGSVIRNPQGDIVHTQYIQPEALQQVLAILSQPPKLYFHGSDNQKTYTESRWKRMKNIYGFQRQSLSSPVRAGFHALRTVYFSPIHQQVNFMSFSQRGGQLANIIVISRDAEALSRKREQLEQIKGIYLTRSGHDNLEVLDQRATKGNALEWLTEYLGVSLEEVAAIGDHDNDASMLELAGIGFATGNAEKTIKERADVVTVTNNEDALWHVYQHLRQLSFHE